MWRAHVLATCSLRNSPWHRMRDTNLMDRYFYTMVYGCRMKRWSSGIRSKEIRRAAFPKTSHRRIQGRMHGGFTALELWSRSDRMRQKNVREKKPDDRKFVATSCWHRPTSVAQTMTRHRLGHRSRVSWWVEGCPDWIEKQIRMRNWISGVQNVSVKTRSRSVGTVVKPAAMNKNTERKEMNSHLCPSHPTKPACVLRWRWGRWGFKTCSGFYWNAKFRWPDEWCLIPH